VGAAVIDGISLTLTQENAYRRRAHLASEVTLGLQLVKGPYALPQTGTGDVYVLGILHRHVSVILSGFDPELLA
jgi:hypothetical protein